MAKKGVKDVDVQQVLSYVKQGFKLIVTHDKYSQLQSVYFRSPVRCRGVLFDRDSYSRYALQKILDTATVAGARHFEVAEQEGGS